MSQKTFILITGAAGFIGYHLCKFLLSKGFSIIGVDNLNSYYDVKLKKDRLNQLGISKAKLDNYNKLVCSDTYKLKMKFIKLDICDYENLTKIFKTNKISSVCNLAAQAGVRESIKNPHIYFKNNVLGFFNVLECCRKYKIQKLVYASSSSVYGDNESTPFLESDRSGNQISFYAATKKSNEDMALSYSHLYGFETIGLRFFSVYGPWGRPDMAYYIFTDAIFKKNILKIFNNGKMIRDFTYIDDVVLSIFKVLTSKSKIKTKKRIYNVGSNNPIPLLDFLKIIEDYIGIKALKKYYSLQKGDLLKTDANIDLIAKHYKFFSKTKIQEGIQKFVIWYKNYHNV